MLLINSVTCTEAVCTSHSKNLFFTQVGEEGLFGRLGAHFLKLSNFCRSLITKQ